MASPDSTAIQEGLTNDIFESAFNQFVDSQYVYFPDYNASSYSSGIIRFDSLATRDQFVIWGDSYLQIPISISTSAGAAYTQYDPISFKNSVLDLITGVQINSGSGQTLVNDNSIQYINNLRLLMETAFDAEFGNMADLQFWKNDLLPPDGTTAGSWGVGGAAFPNPAVYNNPWPDDTPAGAGAVAIDTNNFYNTNYNEGFANRIKFFKCNASFGNAPVNGTFQMIVNIPLRYIHKWFEQLNFPLLNCRFQFNFSTPLIAPTATPAAISTSYMPFMIGSGTDLNPGTALNAPFAAIGGVSSQCRIYYRKVTYSAPLNAKINSMLQAGFKKIVEYPVTDIYNPVPGLPADDNVTTQRIVLVTSSAVAPLRCWLLALPHGQATSATIPFICPANGTTPAQNVISNANILVNNVPYLYNSLIYPKEFYSYLQENMVSHGYNETVGSLISYRDFLTLHNYILFDIHRLKDRLGDPNEACTLQLNFQRIASPAGYNVDWIVLVERKQVMVMDISASGVELAIGSAVSANV